MKKVTEFFKTTFIGGFMVLLPGAILIGILKWIFNFIINMINPLTEYLVLHSNLMKILADLIVVALIILICFIIGNIVKTTIGKYLLAALENNILKKFPGYRLIKETIFQLLGSGKSPFTSVAIVRVFGNDTLVTGFIMDEYLDTYTVFVPTGPNPTSGMIYHVKAANVFKTNANVEETMKSIISCGVGSGRIIEKIIEEGDTGLNSPISNLD